MRRRVLGSVAATLSGWILGWAVLVLFTWYANGYFVARDAPGFFLLMGIFILPVWGLMVLPIYLQVPRASFFWSPFLCVPFGALVGFLIIQGLFAGNHIFLYHSGGHAFDLAWLLSIPGAVVGATTSLVATFTYRRFNGSLSGN